MSDRASCTCGWVGLPRPTRERAERDGDEHITTMARINDSVHTVTIRSGILVNEVSAVEHSLTLSPRGLAPTVYVPELDCAVVITKLEASGMVQRGDHHHAGPGRDQGAPERPPVGVTSVRGQGSSPCPTRTDGCTPSGVGDDRR